MVTRTRPLLMATCLAFSLFCQAAPIAQEDFGRQVGQYLGALHYQQALAQKRCRDFAPGNLTRPANAQAWIMTIMTPNELADMKGKWEELHASMRRGALEFIKDAESVRSTYPDDSSFCTYMFGVIDGMAVAPRSAIRKIERARK